MHEKETQDWLALSLFGIRGKEMEIQLGFQNYFIIIYINKADFFSFLMILFPDVTYLKMLIIV